MNNNESNKNIYYTETRICGDLDYYRAQKIAENMFAAGLISQGEFDKLSVINRETFYPLFVEIMPQITCYSRHLE